MELISLITVRLSHDINFTSSQRDGEDVEEAGVEAEPLEADNAMESSWTGALMAEREEQTRDLLPVYSILTLHHQCLSSASWGATRYDRTGAVVSSWRANFSRYLCNTNTLTPCQICYFSTIDNCQCFKTTKKDTSPLNPHKMFVPACLLAKQQWELWQQ